MFEKFKFSHSQVKQYFASAKRDYVIAKKSTDLEVRFRFGYDSLLKLAIAVSVKEGVRAKARAGHHRELIEKLAEVMEDNDIEVFGNEMRRKRNLDLYDGRSMYSGKEVGEFLEWLEKLIDEVEEYLFGVKKLI